jgi:uncharacterized protein involved in copper resistance
MRTDTFAAALAALALLAACSKPEPAAGAPSPDAVTVDSAKTTDSVTATMDSVKMTDSTTVVDSAKTTVDSTAADTLKQN